MSRIMCFVCGLTSFALLIVLNSESKSQGEATRLGRADQQIRLDSPTAGSPAVSSAIDRDPLDRDDVLARPISFIGGDVDTGVLACLIDTYHSFGYSVTGGTDLDQDGVRDFVVGVPSYDFGHCQKGKVYIYSGMDGCPLQIIDGPDSLSLFGYSVDFLGDENNDGVPELLIGAPGFRNYTGKVYIYSGSNYSILKSFEGENAGDKYGFSVSDAGNTCGDSRHDVIVGAPGAQSGRGRIYVYYSPDWYECFFHSGAVVNDSLGYSVSGAGDVNNDGHDDVIVGAPYFDGVYGPNNGRTLVLSGATGDSLCWDYGPDSNAHFGWSVSELGDVDHDGKVDFLVGAPGTSSNRGKVQVSHNDGLDALDVCDLVHNFVGESSGDRFGHAVSSAGDIDNDTEIDVIIGAPGANSNKGKAYIYLCDEWVLKCALDGGQSNGRFGFSVASAGAVGTQDTYADVIVGAPRVNSNAGEGYVYSGNDSSLIYRSLIAYVSSPAAGAGLCPNHSYTVRWDVGYSSSDSTASIRYSVDNGSNWSPVVSGTANNGSYDWLVPDLISDSCYVEVCCDPCTLSCARSGRFKIGLFSNPAPGDTLYCGDMETISWLSSCNVADTVRLQWGVYQTYAGAGRVSKFESVPRDTAPPTPPLPPIIFYEIAKTKNDGSFVWIVNRNNPYSYFRPAKSVLRICDLEGTVLGNSAPFFVVERPEVALAKEPTTSPETQLVGIYPNPFNPTAHVKFELARRQDVTVEIINILGQTVATLVDESLPPGSHEVVWHGIDRAGGKVSAGVYYCRFRADSYTKTQAMVLLK